MIAILDIGKTNKKCFVFDADYRIVWEKTEALPEKTDEDGDPCEDLAGLTAWIQTTLDGILGQAHLDIRAVNFSAYGASFVLLDAAGQPLAPLYNYLKPFPEDLKTRFYSDYGGETQVALETASPVLGNLNSGLQLYRLKHRKPEVFQQIHTALHLPQYAAFLLSGQRRSDLTSLGCHTQLWDFGRQAYHRWVEAEGLIPLLAPLVSSDAVFPLPGKDSRQSLAGVGLHDSSAALIPYLASFQEPFVLISTGTWCISLNPFNQEPLTAAELEQDCLCYLSFAGKPVKAARYFGGHEHEQAVQRIAAQFGEAEDFYKTEQWWDRPSAAGTAYSSFMRQLVEKQVASTRLAIGNSAVRRIFVDGGFSKNDLYMRLLAEAFPALEVFAAEVAQATALGAALAIHTAWNEKRIPENLILLKKIRV